MKNNLDKVISATLSQLCSKKYISFDANEKKDIKISLIKPIEDAKLSKSEKIVYNILKTAKSSENEFVTMDLESQVSFMNDKIKNDFKIFDMDIMYSVMEFYFTFFI